jgi:hypothetical protein
MELQALYGLAAVPVITALVEVVKRAVAINERFLPVLALVLAIGWNVGVGMQLQIDPVLAATIGIVAGLAASGLYSQTKTTING